MSQRFIVVAVLALSAFAAFANAAAVGRSPAPAETDVSSSTPVPPTLAPESSDSPVPQAVDAVDASAQPPSHRASREQRFDVDRADRSADNELDADQQSASRRHKMLDYFGGGYYAPDLYAPPYQPNPYFAQNFYDPTAAFRSAAAAFGYNPAAGSGAPAAVSDLDDADADDDYMARSTRRKPGSASGAGSTNGGNSPIFYIRLPPTPYMYVPGMGYISQPPTIRPMSQQFPMLAAGPPPPPPPSAHVNPFINVPVSFLANGKPTNVYEWPPAAAAAPQYPSYLPARPLQPARPPGYRPNKPHTPYLPDSKITHLKGPYVFNGRPEDIYVLPGHASPASGPYGTDYDPSGYNSHLQAAAAYHHQQQQQQQYHSQSHRHRGAPPPLAYGDAYNSVYSNAGLYGYY